MSYLVILSTKWLEFSLFESWTHYVLLCGACWLTSSGMTVLLGHDDAN